jgi:aryl-alcohol dehydrogenase-like predicted oxidoreductase
MVLGTSGFTKYNDEASSVAAIAAALDCGITTFDTADSYGRDRRGRAEEILGAVLAPHRDEVVLCTKGGSEFDGRPASARPDRIREALLGSLRRLRTRWVDVYLLHVPDPDVPVEDTMGALTELVAEGLVRVAGCANLGPEDLERAVRAYPGMGCVQDELNLLSRGAEARLLPYCRSRDLAFLAYAPLAQGLLTGKYRPGEPPPADSRAASDAMNASMALVMSEERVAAVERLRPVAEDAGLSLAELALAWVLRRPELASAIVGASRPEQVHANARASGVELTPDTLAAIDEALGDAPVKEPTAAPFARTGITRR